MNLKRKLAKLSFEVRKLIKVVSLLAERNSFRVYLVGGIVRDLILDRANFDLDIVVEGSAIEFAKLLSVYLKVGYRAHPSFGTATVFSLPYNIDLATARREFYPVWGSLPKVEFSTLSDDLRRRDFTINALALGLNKDNFAEIVDYFGGLSDLKKGIIRILHKDSFLEDPTRILRAIRFKERFNFKFDSKTSKSFREAIKRNALSFISEHRIRDELILILQEQEPLKLIKSLNKNVGLNFLSASNLKKRDFLFLKRINEAIIWYKDNLSSGRKLDEWLIYLMGLFKNVPLKRLKFILAKFGFRKGERLRLLSSKKLKVIDKLSRKISPSRVYKILEPFSFETIIFFYSLTPSKIARKNIEEFLSKHNKIRLKIRGADLKELGIYPQSSYGKILEKILYKKIDGKIINKKEEIKEAKKYLA